MTFLPSFIIIQPVFWNKVARGVNPGPIHRTSVVSMHQFNQLTNSKKCMSKIVSKDMEDQKKAKKEKEGRERRKEGRKSEKTSS